MLGIIIYLGNFIALLLILICGLLPLFTRFFLWRSRAAGNAAFRFLSHDFLTPIQLNYTKAVKPGTYIFTILTLDRGFGHRVICMIGCVQWAPFHSGALTLLIDQTMH